MMSKFNMFHMVSPSPWPLLASFQVSSLMMMITYNNNFKKTETMNFILTFFTLLIPTLWWKNIMKESNKEGAHMKKIMTGVKMSMILFITSEVMFFLSFFWAYFHSGISPNIEMGQMWPPIEVKSFNPINVPLLNTIILVSSGFSITMSHHLMLENKMNKSMKALIMTVILGAYFSFLQAMEYSQAEFSLNDSSYGTIFFMATGFHGIHVLIGSTFILINIINMKKMYLTKKHHMGFEMSAWYWHFVDVVWLFLYLSIYWWGM